MVRTVGIGFGEVISRSRGIDGDGSFRGWCFEILGFNFFASFLGFFSRFFSRLFMSNIEVGLGVWSRDSVGLFMVIKLGGGFGYFFF